MRPVVALIWAVGVKVQAPGSTEWETLPPHWAAAFYDASKLPRGLTVVEIDEIPFAFGGGDDDRLDGCTLHYANGEFRVERTTK
jgi:hypothetical protein